MASIVLVTVYGLPTMSPLSGIRQRKKSSLRFRQSNSDTRKTAFHEWIIEPRYNIVIEAMYCIQHVGKIRVLTNPETKRGPKRMANCQTSFLGNDKLFLHRHGWILPCIIFLINKRLVSCPLIMCCVIEWYIYIILFGLSVCLSVCVSVCHNLKKI